MTLYPGNAESPAMRMSPNLSSSLNTLSAISRNIIAASLFPKSLSLVIAMLSLILGCPSTTSVNRTDSVSDSVSRGPFEEFDLSSSSEPCSPSLERGSSSSLRGGSWLLRSSPLSETAPSFALDECRCPSVLSAEFRRYEGTSRCLCWKRWTPGGGENLYEEKSGHRYGVSRLWGEVVAPFSQIDAGSVRTVDRRRKAGLRF